MPLAKNERFVFICDFRVRPSPPEAPSIDIAALYKKIDAHSNKFFSIKKDAGTDKETELTLVKFKLTKSHAIFLFQMRDPNIADQIQKDKKTRKSRSFNRKDGEAPTVSLHMVVSFTPTGKTGDCYSAFIENIPGIGRGAIIQYLIELFKQNFSGTFIPTAPKDKKGKQGKAKTIKPRAYRAYPEILGHSSSTLKSALTGGATFEEIRLIKYKETPTQLGESPDIESEEHSVTLKMKPDFSGKDALTRLVKTVESYKSTYDDAKVKITPTSGRSKVTSIDIHSQNITEQFFIYQEIVTGFKPVLAVCEDEIREDLVKKMIACLN